MNKTGGGEMVSGETSYPRLGLGSRPVVRGAFGLSAAIHILGILAYPYLFPSIQPDGVVFRYPSESAEPGGIEVLRIVEVDVAQDPESPEDPEEIEVVEAEAAVSEQDFSDAPAIELTRPGLTAAERLRPRLTDRRLWAPLPPEFSRLTLEQREDLAIAGRLAEWIDSVSAEAAAEARFTDWTFTDGDGDRWGISDGQLHLGGVTLPIPVFAAPPDAAREYLLQWDEIARQGSAIRIQESVQDRIDAIRARRDRERELERERSEATNDTTRTSR